MSRSAALATHSQAGWVEPRYLAVRLPEATANNESGEPTSKIAGGALRPGSHRVGPFAVQVVIGANGDVGDAAISVRNAIECPQSLAADLVFAKGTLAAELAERGVHYESFSTLRDVIPRLEKLL